ncbi:MAG: diphosphatase [Cypionkella sp.]|uniref:NAD(+) diphosphatase n=1 Tax=Cypionkella sp. TaxID=2811411 RepID=UPI002634C4DC|nr:NAD(+) diphosphatase [Cypionkella sp.]MDB5658413.1 diphosphatase [Cypionkella sp.]MDB5665940.1 diphosphatase [Cypionkella sp.]
MRLAETVTFGGSGLDRAAALRSDAGQIATLRAVGQVLPLWRGKPLVVAQAALGWVAADSVVLGTGDLVFLGLDDGVPRFAQDISAWQPEVLQPSQPAGFMDAARQGHPSLPADFAFEDLRGVMAQLSPREAELAATAKAVLQWHDTHGFCSACGVASDMINAGWQRSCPACGAHHFPRTDPVVIMLVVRGNKLLLGRSAAWPEGMYSLLAGFVEPGETLEAAVRREVFEETGITTADVRYLASQPWPFPASLMFGCIAEATSDEITLDPVELEDALWVTREELVEVMAGQHPKIKPGRKGAIAQFLMANFLAERLD